MMDTATLLSSEPSSSCPTADALLLIRYRQALVEMTKQRDEAHAVIAAHLPHPNGPDDTTPGDPEAWNAAMWNLGEMRKQRDSAQAALVEAQEECGRLRDYECRRQSTIRCHECGEVLKHADNCENGQTIVELNRKLANKTIERNACAAEMDRQSAIARDAQAALVEMREENERLKTRQQELLATIVKVTNTTPFADEARDALEQRGKLLAEIGTLRNVIEARNGACDAYESQSSAHQAEVKRLEGEIEKLKATIEILTAHGPQWIHHALRKLHAQVDLTDPDDPVGIALTVAGLERAGSDYGPDDTEANNERRSTTKDPSHE